MRLSVEHVFGVKGKSAGVAVLCADKHGWAEEVRRDVWSPVYGKKEAISVLNFGTVAALPAEFVTLLLPLEEIHGIPGSLIRIGEQGPATSVKTYLYSTTSEECSFFFAEKGRAWTQGKLSSDAEFVCWQTKRDNGDQLLIFCNGSYVEIDGRRALGCNRTVSHCEMVISNGSKQAYGSEGEALVEEQSASNP